MTIGDLKNEAINWQLTGCKLVNLAIGISALLIYEFVARLYYGPFMFWNLVDRVSDTTHMSTPKFFLYISPG